MKVKRYLASTSKEALRQVKEELGDDAVILSNRKTKNGVEIMALADAEMSGLVDIPTALPHGAQMVKSEKQQPAAPVYSKVPAVTQELIEPPKATPEISVSLMHDIIAEIHAMKTTLEDQLATVAWGNYTQRKPEKMKILRTLLDVGFSPQLSRRLVDKLTPDFDYEQSLKQAMAALTSNLHTGASDEMVEKGGIYALIGPTGVGKTTTTAKLAARCVIRHGADKVALLTTDSYRIGGHEQLKIYGQLLGIPVRNIKDTDDLQLTLYELRNKHMVLIDTIGMSQRDHMVAEQSAMLSNCGADIKRMLILSAASNGKTLDEVISAYQNDGIFGCIITKIDEAASLGVALDAVIRRKLMLHYVTNGQKVPEDIHAANARYLLHRIFKSSPGESAFTLQDAEFALIMAGKQDEESVRSNEKSFAGFHHD
ncbi:flagellar biosynthesis protein FlhF [Nitrosomonas sp. JL21]|uniref:flagellar biosynthesis protein FlhF n=1 Tax=Nitrosomonas sp. JL21 TaxID=153949 RepID=UPI0013699419|nr:flagellar biosynthesis protein FlhF [Nitrosomonas sp. JL21]MBL8496884.1 flagellar biosynthesis protein FlhF [Nitrosomonas sp.]MBL8498065.1 flagellar biosynthesis protein FlhF [Nitrosomonas sp.]MXS77658.1 flagellar biosynthesis protein FlhF [Nitrosomonas sp. JL21]